MQELVSSGHSWSSIQSYSLSEVGAFLKATISVKDRERREHLTFSWMGTHLSHKGLKSMLNEMDKAVKTRKAAVDPDVVDSEWKRLIKFQKGMR